MSVKPRTPPTKRISIRIDLTLDEMAQLVELTPDPISKRQLATAMLRKTIAKAAREGRAKGYYLLLDPHARRAIDEAK